MIAEVTFLQLFEMFLSQTIRILVATFVGYLVDFDVATVMVAETTQIAKFFDALLVW